MLRRALCDAMFWLYRATLHLYACCNTSLRWPLDRCNVRRLLVALFIPILLTVALVPPHEAQAEDLPWRDKSTPFGMVANVANRVRRDEMSSYIQLLQEANVQWVREEIFWHEVQFSPGGEFRWGGNDAGLYDYDMSIGALHNANISILGLLDYNPAWTKGTAPNINEWIGAWGDYVYQTVARYGRTGQIRYWEIWNEPNLKHFGYESGLYTIADYVRVLNVARDAAKAADPNAVIVLSGLASVWSEPPSPYTYDYFDYLDQLGKLGAWQLFDVLAIHPYRPDAPEGSPWRRDTGQTFPDEMEHLDAMMRKYGAKPVWLTEVGFPSSGWNVGVGLDQQAQFMVRLYVLAIAHPSVEKIFWYDFRNDMSSSVYDQPNYNSNEPEFHYGLIRRTFPLNVADPNLRKPAFLAYRTMAELLRGSYLKSTFANGRQPDLPATYWFRFEGERRVDVLWNTDRADQVVNIPCNCREAMVRRWNGEIRYVIYPVNGVLSLKLDEQGSPTYLEFDPAVQSGGRYFAETGHSVRGGFLSFWQSNGGLQRFGYPLTEEVTEPAAGSGRPKTVQYFERARLEYFPDLAGTSYAVQLGHLGTAVLKQFGIDWTTLPKVESAPPECQLFPESGHSICPPFLSRWQQLGGLEFVGLPITEPFPATDPSTGQSYTVQYFERARFEFHPDKAGTDYEVQFGLLGREILTRWGGT
ncbi:hypothetical protein F8S13_08870 [Chloroflexia bacterium SDU3-3]|nr:hypothetical protein F8S13_08870 [Chloroflexia bacterium SDU3-3]